MCNAIIANRYDSCLDDVADKVAEDFGMTPIKVRKMLITSGAYQTATRMKVNNLYSSGKSVKEIQAATGLSPASISGYLPYRKTVYNLEESTCVAIMYNKLRVGPGAVKIYAQNYLQAPAE